MMMLIKLSLDNPQQREAFTAALIQNQIKMHVFDNRSQELIKSAVHTEIKSMQNMIPKLQPEHQLLNEFYDKRIKQLTALIQDL